MWRIGFDPAGQTGEQGDYSALAFLESTGEYPEVVYHIRHLERFPRQMEMADLCEVLCQRLHQLSAHRDTELLIDIRGVGASLPSWLNRLGVRSTSIVVHGGHKSTVDEDGTISLAKVDLVSTLRLLMRKKRLRLGEDLPYRQAFLKECLDYRYKITRALNTIFGVWREGQHDDLLFSVGMCVWMGEHRGMPAWSIAPEVDPEWRARNMQPTFQPLWSGNRRERWRAFVHEEAQKGLRQESYGRDDG